MSDDTDEFQGLTHEYHTTVRIVPADTPGVTMELVYEALRAYPGPGVIASPER